MTPASLYVTAPAAGAPGSVVREFSGNLEVVRTLAVPGTTDERARDLAVADGRVYVFNGTASPLLSSFDVGTNARAAATAPGWDAGIGSGGSAFVTDGATAAGPEGGVARFDRASGAAVRFAEGTSPIDVAVGGPGWIYTLDANRTVRVYRPDTLGRLAQFELPASVVVGGSAPVVQGYRALAVNGQGAERDRPRAAGRHRCSTRAGTRSPPQHRCLRGCDRPEVAGR